MPKTIGTMAMRAVPGTVSCPMAAIIDVPPAAPSTAIAARAATPAGMPAAKLASAPATRNRWVADQERGIESAWFRALWVVLASAPARMSARLRRPLRAK